MSHGKRRHPRSAALRLALPVAHCGEGRLDRVRAPDMLPALGEEVVEGEHVLLVLLQTLNRPGTLRPA